MRICIVEDNEESQILLSKMLLHIKPENDDYSVTCCSAIEELTSEKLGRNSFDIILVNPVSDLSNGETGIKEQIRKCLLHIDSQELILEHKLIFTLNVPVDFFADVLNEFEESTHMTALFDDYNMGTASRLMISTRSPIVKFNRKSAVVCGPYFHNIIPTEDKGFNELRKTLSGLDAISLDSFINELAYLINKGKE